MEKAAPARPPWPPRTRRRARGRSDHSSHTGTPLRNGKFVREAPEFYVKQNVANVGSGSVSIFDPHTETEVAVIPADKGTHGVTLTPDETQAWTANVQADTVSVIDLASHRVIRTIQVGSKPMLVAFTPDGKKAYVSGLTADPDPHGLVITK